MGPMEKMPHRGDIQVRPHTAERWTGGLHHLLSYLLLSVGLQGTSVRTLETLKYLAKCLGTY